MKDTLSLGLVRSILIALVIYLAAGRIWGNEWGLIAGGGLLILSRLHALHQRYLQPRLIEWALQMLMRRLMR